MQQPEDLENFELDVSGEVSEETNEFEGSASGTFDSEATTTGKGQYERSRHRNCRPTRDEWERVG